MFQLQIYTSPIKTDDEILYDLNAKIRDESRKTVDNPESSIKATIQKFKIENPQLLAKIRREKSTPNYNRSDISSNVKTSSNLDTVNDSSNNQNRSSKIDDPQNLATVQTKEIQSNDSNEDRFDTNDTNTYTAVKSSTELLNTLISINEDIHKNRTSSNNDADAIEINIYNENLNNESSSIPNMDNNYNEMEIDENSKSDDNIESDHESESDLAEALTQIIEEQSEDIINSDQDSDMSIDEELMRETVEEIADALEETTYNLTLDNIVFTPPLEFRDLN